MRALPRILIGLVLVTAAAYVALLYGQLYVKRGQKPPEVVRTENQNAQLIAQFAHPTMTIAEASGVPTYSDFTKVLRDSVVAVVGAKESLQRSLLEDSDLLDRYQPDGVPGRHLANYLAQNKRWKILTLRSLNERARALKNAQGEIDAFLISHPEDAKVSSAAVRSAIEAGLAAIKPGADIVHKFAAARALFAQRHDTQSRAEYEQTFAAFDAWRASV